MSIVLSYKKMTGYKTIGIESQTSNELNYNRSKM